MRKEFYVFRHGETDLNLQKRWQGSGMNYDLNETGVRQAQGLIEKLKDKNLEIIFSSPLVRAKHTAQVLGDALRLPVVVKDDLRECFYGDAEGQLIADLQHSCPEIVNNWNKPQYMNIAFANGERKDVALNRVWAVLDELKDLPYQRMGIAIHGGTMAAMLNKLNFSFDKIPNCAAFLLVWNGSSWQMEGNLL